MKWRYKIIISLLLLSWAFLILNAYVPVHERLWKSDNCRLCGATKSKRTVYIYRIPVQSKTNGIRNNDFTVLYDKYIAESHEHQWVGGSFGRDVNYLFGSGMHADGGWHYGDKYPIFQYRVTHDVLSVMEVFEHEPVEFRRQAFRELIECTDLEEYGRLKELIEAMRSDSRNNRKLYDAYKQKQTNQQ
jgi:hypothetical protein